MTSSACTDSTRFSGVTISTFSFAIFDSSSGSFFEKSELQLLRLPRDRFELQQVRVRHPRGLPRHVQHALHPLEVLLQLPEQPPPLVLQEVLQPPRLEGLAVLVVLGGRDGLVHRVALR